MAFVMVSGGAVPPDADCANAAGAVKAIASESTTGYIEPNGRPFQHLGSASLQRVAARMSRPWVSAIREFAMVIEARRKRWPSASTGMITLNGAPEWFAADNPLSCS